MLLVLNFFAFLTMAVYFYIIFCFFFELFENVVNTESLHRSKVHIGLPTKGPGLDY